MNAKVLEEIKKSAAVPSMPQVVLRFLEIMRRAERIDPFIKQRYADTSLKMGDHSTKVLELYLGLVQEVPENRTEYYQKISMIYTLNGSEKEANRFRVFAEQSQNAS